MTASDTNFILSRILNTICKRCYALEYGCRGLTINNQVEVKVCELWEDRGYSLEEYSHLNVPDYIATPTIIPKKSDSNKGIEEIMLTDL